MAQRLTIGYPGYLETLDGDPVQVQCRCHATSLIHIFNFCVDFSLLRSFHLCVVVYYQ
jgi:hypothetical protein